MDLTSYMLGKKSGGGGSSGGRDWTEIGYTTEPKCIEAGFDYAKQIQQNWTPSTSLSNKFYGDRKLIFMPYVDTSSTTAFNNMFYMCSSLISVPQLDTSNGLYFGSMFCECGSLKTIPQLNTSKLTACNNMFMKCYSLKNIPFLDISKSNNCSYMFNDCKSLETIPQLDTSNAESVESMFGGCDSINNIPELDFGKVTNVSGVIGNTTGTLINLGGFKDLGKAYLTTRPANTYVYTVNLQINSLSHDSLMNVINKVYDIATKGCNAQKLMIGSTNIAKLTAEELAIATNKGWTVS